MRTLVALGFAGLLLISCSDHKTADVSSSEKDIDQIRKLEGEELVKRGQYLVTVGGCYDCHSPKIFTPQGPVPDSTRLLSGHPANSPELPIDLNALKPGSWILMAPDITSFVGPWGRSFAANLTPDSATGIGAWTEANFRNAIRTGKHMGIETGRPIMPPMPWPEIRHMTDEDFSAVYAFLRSLPPVSNKVPAPMSPSEVIAKQQSFKLTAAGK
jgi:hypothetical protein